jgi:hypothetical protein
LAWLHRALTVDFGRSGRGLLLLDFFVWDSLWNNINKKLEIVEMRDCTCWGMLDDESEEG